VADFGTERWTAVSASPQYAEQVRRAVKEVQRPNDLIVLGNWGDPDLLKYEIYDTVIVDYFLGAIERVCPLVSGLSF